MWFGEAISEHDINKFYHLLSQYAIKDVVMVFKRQGSDIIVKYDFIEINGIDAVTSFMDKSFTAVPDCIFTLKSAKLYIAKDDYCVILCEFSSVGTKVVDLTTDHHQTTIIVSNPLETSSNSYNSGSSIIINDNIIGFAVDSTDRTLLQQPPITTLIIKSMKSVITKVDAEGKLNFYINNFKLIYRIEFIHRHVTR
jgi:hypothetical protein